MFSCLFPDQVILDAPLTMADAPISVCLTETKPAVLVLILWSLWQITRRAKVRPCGPGKMQISREYYQNLPSLWDVFWLILMDFCPKNTNYLSKLQTFSSIKQNFPPDCTISLEWDSQIPHLSSPWPCLCCVCAWWVSRVSKTSGYLVSWYGMVYPIGTIFTHTNKIRLWLHGYWITHADAKAQQMG